MTESFWFLMSMGFALALGLMVLTWVFARWVNNASVVDVAWSLGFTLLVGAYWLVGRGASDRKTLIAVMVAVWSLRLGTYLWRRVAKHHPEEDGRYGTLRAQFPNHPWLMFFGFFQLAGCVAGFADGAVCAGGSESDRGVVGLGVGGCGVVAGGDGR